MGVTCSHERGRSLLSEGGLSTTKHRLDSFVFPWCRIRAVFGVQSICDLTPLFPPQGEIVASSSALGHLTESFGLPKKRSRSRYEGHPAKVCCFGEKRTPEAEKGLAQDGTCGTGRSLA